MLEIKGLGKRFGHQTALDGVSLTIRPGEFVGVIGRSGAGKSTLLRCINRLSDPSDGDVAFEGRSVTELKGRAKRLWQRECAMIFQQFNLVARLDVLTNVLMGRLSYQPTYRSLFKLFSARERALAVLTLDRVEMTPFALQRADTLSGGQQQRVAIARALVQEPRILLADEPIASLDPRGAARVMDILASINQEDGITVVCNLHTLDTARRYCNRVIGMRSGRIVYDGSPQGLDSDTVRQIYGVTEDGEDVHEDVTSSALPDNAQPSCAPAPGRLEHTRRLGHQTT